MLGLRHPLKVASQMEQHFFQDELHARREVPMPLGDLFISPPVRAEEVGAGLDQAALDRDLDVPAVIGRDRVAAEDDLGDHEPGPSEAAVSHAGLPVAPLDRALRQRRPRGSPAGQGCRQRHGRASGQRGRR